MGMKLAKEQTERFRLICASDKPFFTRQLFEDLVRQVDSMNSAVTDGGAHYRFEKGGLPHSFPKFSTLTFFGDSTEEVEACQVIYGHSEVLSTETNTPAATIPSYALRYNSTTSFLNELVSCERNGTSVHPDSLCPLAVSWEAQDLDPHTNQKLPSFKSLPLEEVNDAFEAGVKEWEASDACHGLRAALKSAEISTTITKIGMYSQDLSQRCQTFRENNFASSRLKYAIILNLDAVAGYKILTTTCQ